MVEADGAQNRDRMQILVLSLLAANLFNVWLVFDSLAHLWPGVGVFGGPNLLLAGMISLVAVVVSMGICTPSLKTGNHRILAIVALVLSVMPVPLFCVTLQLLMSNLGLVYK